MKVLPETWGYFCMKNFTSTTRNCHSHIHESTHFILFALLNVRPRFFPRLVCGPPKFMGPGAPPWQTPWACSDLIDTDSKLILSVTPNGATTTPSLLRAANATVCIHSVLANKLPLALMVTGKVTDSDTVLVFCLMYSQSQY
jgi:hypothetical protein